MLPRTPQFLDHVVDNSLLDSLPPYNPNESTEDLTVERFLPALDGHPRMVFTPATIARLRNPCGWLDCDAMNSTGQVLKANIGVPTAAGGIPIVLSTYAMTVQRDPTGNDEKLWGIVRRTRFWEQNVWIVPIHQPDHWVVAVVYLEERRIAYFDSFAPVNSWDEEAKVSTHVAIADVGTC